MKTESFGAPFLFELATWYNKDLIGGSFMSSLQALKKEELQKLAHKFEIAITEDTTKTDILDLLSEEGVTYATYKKFFIDPPVEEDFVWEEEGGHLIEEKEDNGIITTATLAPSNEDVELESVKVEKPGNGKSVLVKMDRQNPSFEALGWHFTKEHPYVLMPSDEASHFLDSFEGFRLATPTEAQSYYA
jgi:hypothetical protein